MNLAELFDGLVDIPSKLDSRIEISGIALDSRKVKKGFIFIAVAGALQHGLAYVQQAVKNGANSVIYDPQGSESYMADQLGIFQLSVNGLGTKLGAIADRFYRSPSRKIDVIGVTGTNGKTSCSQFLFQLLPECGIIGTLGWGVSGHLKHTSNTTPDALAIQEILAGFVELKKQVVVMEVSSHSLKQGRVNEVCFKGAVYTNLSRDHLDYHGTMEEYLQTKLVLFKQPELQYVVVNADDDNSDKFLSVVDKAVKRWTFSAKGNKSCFAENITADKIQYSLSGISFYVCWKSNRVLVQTAMVGDFNLENILAVIAVLLAEGYSLNDTANKVGELVPVLGRMEDFGGNGKPFVFVDYAHTPDALEKVLQSLRKHCMHKLWLVFGCGGDRDKGKRVQMGAIAKNLADQVMITDDNPRLEDAEQIINDILGGCLDNNIEVIQNREKAIQTTIKNADKNDCIVVAGKGHEDYQDINGVKHPFSDQEIVEKALKGWIAKV